MRSNTLIILIVSLLIISCEIGGKTEANLTAKDVAFITTIIPLDEDEKIEYFDSNGGLKGIKTAGNFITNKRVTSYWINNKSCEKHSITFTDIDSIKLTDNSKSVSYASYIQIFGSLNNTFKFYIDSDSSRVYSFYNTINTHLSPTKKVKAINKKETEKESKFCNAKAADFIKLKKKNLQSTFFLKLDSIRKVQYPNNDQESSIMVDITPEYLNDFLTTLNIDTLKSKHRFTKEYHFNVAPKGYTDPKLCKDKIEIVFDSKNCCFRLNIYNTFLVDSDWCTESMVVYVFQIINDTIVTFWRNEVG